MKRVTVAITLAEDAYPYHGTLRSLKTAMVNAAVAKATEKDLSISAITAKVAHNVRKP